MSQRPIIVAARTHRARLTPHEEKFWGLVMNGRISGFVFRKQHVVDRFILDFYCPQACLAIEIDGPSHLSADAQVHDRERTAWLDVKGIRVLRFSNEDIELRIHKVREILSEALLAPPSLQNEFPNGRPPRSGGQIGEADRGAKAGQPERSSSSSSNQVAMS